MPEELKFCSQTAIAAIFSVSNLFFYRHTGGYFASDAAYHPLLMTWTLGLEEQFYFVIPLLLLAMRRLRWQIQFGVIGGLALISLFAWIWASTYHPQFAFYLLPARAWELGVGVLLAIYAANRARAARVMPRFAAHSLSIFGICLIAAALLMRHGHSPGQRFAALLCAAGAALLIAQEDGIVNRALSWRPIVFIGRVSYSWYLWHWPLLSFA